MSCCGRRANSCTNHDALEVDAKLNVRLDVLEAKTDRMADSLGKDLAAGGYNVHKTASGLAALKLAK